MRVRDKDLLSKIGRGSEPNRNWGKGKRQSISLITYYRPAKFHSDRLSITMGTVCNQQYLAKTERKQLIKQRGKNHLRLW